ncbi:MAG: LysR family transcriptional regulator [Halieaceae bacterium]
MRLETQELRVLAAVIENRGFKRAAEQLAISQSAVSQALAGLERKLDQSLVQRSPLAPTDAGMRLLTYAQSQAREEEVLLSDLQDIRRGESAKLALAVNGTINRYHAPRLVLQYCQQQPYAQLQLDELPSRQVIQSVLAGGAELGMGPFQTHMPALECIPLYEELRILVVADRHPLAELLASDVEAALAQIPLLASYLDDPEERPGMQRIRDYFSRVWEVRSISLRLQLLAAGHAVGYVSDQLLVEEPLCEALAEVSGLPFSRIPRQVGLFYRKDSSLSEGARRFLELCRDTWQA